jgi:hypothetical protein
MSSFWTAGSIGCNMHGLAVWAVSERSLIGLRSYGYREGDEPTGGGLYPNPDYKTTSGLWDELRHLGGYTMPRLGLGCRVENNRDGRRIYYAYLPHWLASLSFALLPTVWYLRAAARLRRRRGRGCCVHCGYDLRATPDRCPECGTAPAARAAQAEPTAAAEAP